MPMKTISNGCQLNIEVMTDEGGQQVNIVLCQNKEQGKPCPKDARHRPYELQSNCFVLMSESDFLYKIAMPTLRRQKAMPTDIGGVKDVSKC